MHPVLFQVSLGGHEVALRTYGVAVAAAFVVGVVLATRAASRHGEDPDRVRDLCFWILVAALAGSRLAYVAVHARGYTHACLADGDCLRPLKLWEGGLVFYGGLAGAAAATAWFVRRNDLSFLRVADLLVAPLALGHALGRVGCFLAGCCWGRPASGIATAWAARFPSESAVFQDLWARGLLGAGATHTEPLHPTQLYEAGAELALFALLTALARKDRKGGDLLAVWLVGYALMRFAIETLRDDPARQFLLGLSTSQLVSVAALGAAALLAWRRSTRAADLRG